MANPGTYLSASATTWQIRDVENFSIFSAAYVKFTKKSRHLARMPMTRLPRQFLTSWVNHPRPHGRPQYTYGHSLTKSLKRTGIPPVFKEWSQLAQDRSNWRKLFYSKAEFPPTRQNWSFCSHFCMYFSHFRTSESIDVQSSAMQTHLHSKLLVIWIYLEGYLIIIIIIR